MWHLIVRYSSIPFIRCVLGSERGQKKGKGPAPMNKPPEIRCYDYVNHPYEKVRDALKEQPLEIFRNATKDAASRVRSVASELRVNIVGIEIGTDISVAVTKIEESPGTTSAPPKTLLHLAWEAAKLPRLFPIMTAELALYRLTGTETQLDFCGFYQPPLGALGNAINALAGRRIAEASVHRFLENVATYLKTTLSVPTS